MTGHNETDIISHYDSLIDEGNDPVHDPEPLRVYMDKWDGEQFIGDLGLTGSESVLEIGVGTGRLAVRIVPKCGQFTGIDISPKTIDRARENLAAYKNVSLICGDFTSHKFDFRFDIIYSSLTFMHIRDKQAAISKAAKLLNSGGRFVLSIDKAKEKFIDTGTRKLAVYPDDPEEIRDCLENAGLVIVKQYETEFGFVFAAK
jgi:ubiquinone/menaquinone biosynthesis C-methylase UbiE